MIHLTSTARSLISTSGLTIATLALPHLAGAVTFLDTLALLNTILNATIGLFITLAIVVFFWGLIKYLWTMGKEDAHEGLRIMFWGVIAIFVMVSIWGIIRLLQSTLRVNSTDPIIPKGVQINTGVYYQ